VTVIPIVAGSVLLQDFAFGTAFGFIAGVAEKWNKKILLAGLVILCLVTVIQSYTDGRVEGIGLHRLTSQMIGMLVGVKSAGIIYREVQEAEDA